MGSLSLKLGLDLSIVLGQQGKPRIKEKCRASNGVEGET